MTGWLRWAAVTLASVTTMGLAACGSDEPQVTEGEPETSGTAAEDRAAEAEGAELERYCRLQRELADGGDVAKLDALIVAAPPEIAQEVRVVAEAYKVVLESGDDEAAAEVADQEAAMHAFNEAKCDIPNPLEEE